MSISLLDGDLDDQVAIITRSFWLLAAFFRSGFAKGGLAGVAAIA